MIKEFLLTPARFDMLRIVHLRPDGIPQSTLRWLLGVSAPTVSRMLKSLQELGFVERERDVADGRCVNVRLTPRGRVAVRMALETTVVNLEADRTAARGVAGNTREWSESLDETRATIAAGREQLETLHGLLGRMRMAFIDTAPYAHPWQPGPFGPVTFTGIVKARSRYGDDGSFATLSA
jgi:DNA-binding MarR family transcriptional regulator